MKKAMFFLIVMSLILAGCGGSRNKEPSLEERIIGKWSGVQTSVSGDKVPAVWEFIEGGTMIIRIVGMDISFGATWSVQDNRINIVPEIDPERSTYRDVEFVSDDVMKLTKEDIVETWARLKE